MPRSDKPGPESYIEREAKKVFRQVEAKRVIIDYAREQQDFHKNRERLKAERLAREAASKKKT